MLPLVFFFTPTVGLSLAQWGIFFRRHGHHRAVQFLGNYLPRVYPTYCVGREVCLQRRGPNDRNMRRAHYDEPGQHGRAAVPIKLACLRLVGTTA
jgi:hypothetical protein